MSQANVTLTPAAARAKRLGLILLIIMTVGSIGLDQVSKVHAQDKLMKWSDATDPAMYQGQRYPLWAIGSPLTDGEFYLSFNTNYVRNLGAAWGVLSNLPDNVRGPFFFLVTIMAVVIIGLYMRTTPSTQRLTIFALGLVLSGAIGNFIDRIRLGYVIDWIDVRWNIVGWRYDFPNFNIADSAITVGVACLIFDAVVLDHLRSRAAAKPAPAS